MENVEDLWAASDPRLWRLAASDWRALWVEAQAPRRGRRQLAQLCGYASESKIDTLTAQARRLRRDAAAGDADAAGRLDRAQRLGGLLGLPLARPRP